MDPPGYTDKKYTSCPVKCTSIAFRRTQYIETNYYHVLACCKDEGGIGALEWSGIDKYVRIGSKISIFSKVRVLRVASAGTALISLIPEYYGVIQVHIDGIFELRRLNVKIIIHRGANEIGGTCIQLSTENTTILLDLGLPLSKDSKLLDVSTLKPDAVLISHPHQDHFGLIDMLDSEIPVFIGELGKNLIDATRILIGSKLHTNNFHHFKSWEPFTIGDFEVTPYLVDHSAVDAYGFLIEAEGKRVFYSGDFRAHGRKSVLFDNIVKKPPKDIDVLFMEGTMMQRNNDKFPTESDVEQTIFETIKVQKNITFIISSSQNIDRIVSAFRACKRAGKTLVIDIYTAWVLEQLKLVSNSIPSMEWEQVKVYTSFNQDNRLKEHPEFFGDFRKRIYKQRVHKEELHANPDSYLFFGKMSHFKIINLHKEMAPVNVVYSQWLGYLSCSDEDYYGAEAIAGYQKDPQVNFVYAHTSGHATVQDLQRFAGALNPKMLVPVHTECGESYRALFNNVALLQDSIEFKIGG